MSDGGTFPGSDRAAVPSEMPPLVGLLLPAHPPSAAPTLPPPPEMSTA